MNAFKSSIVRPLLAVMLAFTPLAHCFELSPLPTASEKRAAKKNYGILFRALYPVVDLGLHQFSTPVHEALTLQGLGCNDGIDDCKADDLISENTGIIVGVRWNDDPPFEFAAGQGNYATVACPKPTDKARTISFSLRTACWLKHFYDISAIADAQPLSFVTGNGTLLARTHFGDLQFLHAMAEQAGIAPQTSHAKLMMWAEFTWRVQSGWLDAIPLSTRMGDVPVSGLIDHFPAKENRSVELLFTLGRPWLRHHIRDIAFGSLLHTVQDSFAQGHVARRTLPAGDCAPSEITQFHTYAGQDKKAHKAHDSLDNARSKTQLVSVLREIVDWRFQNKHWHEVKPLFEQCVFKLAADATPSSIEITQ
jgi:hypothetical protein